MAVETDTSAIKKSYCIHAYISGRVQGVWFRAFTKAKAIQADVTGWAKNLADGRVEVMLTGEKDKVEKVLEALLKGPRLAKVTHIEKEVIEAKPYQDFSTS